MPYVRTDDDWYVANGDSRSPAQRAADFRRDLEDDKHMPDSVREELQQYVDQHDDDGE